MNPGEAKTQTNLRACTPGELSVRKEPEAITFSVGTVIVDSGEPPSGGDQWISLDSYTSPAGETFVVGQADDFDVHAFMV
jgi:hypothetical protein